jgi:hypothetical protein
VPLHAHTTNHSHPADRVMYDSAIARLQADTIAGVNFDMHGQEERRIHEALVDRLQSRLPGATLDQRNLTKIAKAISRGTLREWPGNTHPHS